MTALGAGRAALAAVLMAGAALAAPAPETGFGLPRDVSVDGFRIDELIRELQDRSGGLWHPSPGSIYPTLQLLEDQGQLTSEDVDGKRVYSITEEGRAHLEERRAKGGDAPWDVAGQGRERFGKLFGAMSQLGAAVMQVARGGTSEQVDRVTDIVGEARKKIYTLLSED